MATTAEEAVPAAPPSGPVPGEPSRSDVDRYLRLRAASRRLNHDLLVTVPPHAMDYVGAAIGILCGRTFFLETEDVAAVLADCCFFDWTAEGVNVVERFARETPPLEGTYEHALLEAMLRARYDVLDAGERLPGVGLRASSLVDGRDVLLLDLDLGRNEGIEGVTLAARLLPVGGFWMTSAPELEISRPLAVAALRTFARTTPAGSDGPAGPLEDHELVLTIVRACLEGRRGRRAQAAVALERSA